MPDATFKEAKKKARQFVNHIGAQHADIDKETLIYELTRLYVIESKFKENQSAHTQ